MNEKSLKVLEQYELEVKNIRRGRDSYIVDTDRGIVLLGEYNGSNQRAAWIEQVCRKVRERGMEAELPIVNKEGEFVSCDREEKRYMVRLWVPGREIETKNQSEVLEAVRNLARLHNVLSGLDGEDGVFQKSPEEIYDKRMRELRRILRYLKEKKRKNAFELQFLKEYGYFWEMCQKAKQRAGTSRMKQAWKEEQDAGMVCHGNYNQHNILRQDNTLATVHFENCVIGLQSSDLYCFMRKMLEKSGWNISLGETMLHTYMEQRELSAVQLEQLCIQFEFSEKFWKIANHYYNSKKTWIPDRSLQKLEHLVAQAPKQAAFVEYLHQNYL